MGNKLFTFRNLAMLIIVVFVIFIIKMLMNNSAFNEGFSSLSSTPESVKIIALFMLAFVIVVVILFLIVKPIGSSLKYLTRPRPKKTIHVNGNDHISAHTRSVLSQVNK